MADEEELAPDTSEETLDTETLEVDETTEEESEVEVVDTSIVEEKEEGEPPTKKPRSRPRREVRRLRSDKGRLTTELAESNSQIQNLQNQINNMQTGSTQGAPQQQPAGEKMPVLADFMHDETQHNQALQDWHQRQIDTTVNTRMTQFNQETNAQQQQVLAEQRQQTHYQAADELQVSDYAEAEDTAFKLLGQNLVNEIVNRSENSATVLYHFGKNPQAAIDFANLAKRDAVGAAMKLGSMSASLKVRKKVNGGRADPESKIEGSAASKSPSNSAFQKKYDAAVKSAGETGNISAMQKVSREAKAAGVTVT